MSEGMAPMGWSLGAAVGAALADAQRPVVALLGDGSMRMHGIELSTAARWRLPILYVLFENRAHCSVLHRMATAEEQAQARLPAVDWLGFAAAFGVGGCRAADAGGLARALAAPWPADAPWLLVVEVPAVDAEACDLATGIDWRIDGAAD